MSLRVSEMFYSIQGEGPTTGTPAVFLRLGGCNLLCGGKGTIEDKKLHDGATWRCDTIEVWSGSTPFTVAELVAEFQKRDFVTVLSLGAHLIITGGEPLMQQGQIIELLTTFRNALGFWPYVEIETNGTIEPDLALMLLVNQFNVSPKLKNSGMPAERRIKGQALNTLANHGVVDYLPGRGEAFTIFKFVVTSFTDVEEVYRDYLVPFNLPTKRVYLMPGADNRADLNNLSAAVAEFCKENVLNFSNRLHIELWDKKTGV